MGQRGDCEGRLRFKLKLVSVAGDAGNVSSAATVKTHEGRDQRTLVSGEVQPDFKRTAIPADRTVWTRVATSESSGKAMLSLRAISARRTSWLPPLPCGSPRDTNITVGGIHAQRASKGRPLVCLSALISRFALKRHRRVSTFPFHGNMCCENRVLV